jgi:programmed cell death 6-interacting protein
LITGVSDLFSALVPVAVSQALAAYDVRRTEIVNMEIGRLREHTQLLNGFVFYSFFSKLPCSFLSSSILTSLNLPAALDDVTNAQTLPESLRHKSAKVKADGGLQELERMINELPILQKRNKEILDEVGTHSEWRK